MATGDRVSARNMHIELKIHNVRALLKKTLVVLSYISSKKHSIFIEKSARYPAREVFIVMSRIRT